ncbi:Uncharacterised protein [Mycobacterium tuberculosis]|nr:Uncharacterised protein [Mycobacterium tuberculosis]
MPGRFREGTETCIRKVRTLETLPTCRQTQNPERGRKRPVDGGCVVRASVVRPKTPRGDGNSITLFLSVARLRVSSDPKPREGTETRKRSTSLTILFSRRQTQNPERGRKLDAESHRVREVQQSSDPKPREGTETHIARHTTATLLLHVLRPKTPRGDGNPHGGTWTSATIGVVGPKTPRGDGNYDDWVATASVDRHSG